MKKHWWKVLACLLMVYGLIMAWYGKVSVQPVLNETIRNLYFHVTMWFAMFILFVVSLVMSIRQLRSQKIEHDQMAQSFALTGLMMGFIGIFTGAVWANATWGKPWVIEDPQLNGAAVSVLAYLAYFLLRSGIADPAKKARISAVYNIFAFTLMFILIGIFPRINDSLHPGKGGNPGFGAYDKDQLVNSMRPVFYSLIIGWALVGSWISILHSRVLKLKNQLES